MTIPNGKTTYSVIYGNGRLASDSQLDAGIVVKDARGKEITLYFDTNTLYRDIEGIDLKPEK